MEHPVLSSLQSILWTRTAYSEHVSQFGFLAKSLLGLGRDACSAEEPTFMVGRGHVFGYAQIKNLFVFFSPFISDSPAFHLLISFSVFKSECFPSLFVSSSACSHLLPCPSQPFILCLLFFCGFSFMSIKLAFLFSNLPAVVSYICHFCQTVPHVNII